MNAHLTAPKTAKVVQIARGPLDEPGFTFTPTGLEIDPDVSFERWERYGRKLQLADKGIQWALGDWVVFGEHHPNSTFRERASQAVEFTGRKVKTIQNYATVAENIPKSRRRDSEVVDFSTHAEVAMLPAAEQERILSKAEENPTDFSSHDARKEAKRTKRKLKLIPDEIDLLHDSEVQAFLDQYVDHLKRLDECVPRSALFLHNMIQAHIGQAQWQKERTIEFDCGAILDTFDEVYTQTDQDIFRRLRDSGHFISDPDLDDRLEAMVQSKQLKRVKTGGRQETRRGDMVDLYMLHDQPTGDAANVNKAESRYDSGERE